MNASISEIAGLLGTALTIGAYFIPENWKSKKATIISFTVTIIILCTIIITQSQYINRIHKTSRAAQKLIQETEEFTNEGYIQATLTFLEQNKEIYPDAYNRATQMYNRYLSKLDSNDNIVNQIVDLRYEMKGLIKGIAILSSEE